MQRIKSQSTCNPHGPYTVSQSRGRSKKTSKGQTPDLNHNAVSKHKQNKTGHTQNSMISIKSGPKQSGSSMKNLRIGSNQMSGKNSVQNTSRENGHNSAISARILKQIIGYSNRIGNKGSKQVNEETSRVNIDLGHEL